MRKVRTFTASRTLGLDEQVNRWLIESPEITPINITITNHNQDEYIMSVLYDDTYISVAVRKALDEFYQRGKQS